MEQSASGEIELFSELLASRAVQKALDAALDAECWMLGRLPGMQWDLSFLLGCGSFSPF